MMKVAATPSATAARMRNATVPSAMNRPNAQAAAEPRESRQMSKHWRKTLAISPEVEEKLGLLPGSAATRSSSAHSPA